MSQPVFFQKGGLGGEINKKMIKQILLNLCVLSVLILLGAGATATAYASTTSMWTQVINSGTLSADIVDASYESVTSPGVTMGAKTISIGFQTATGTLGTTTQQMYLKNLDASDAGWDLTLGASSLVSIWSSGSNIFDFNDPTGSGCTNGQMTIDPSVATLAKGQCTSCDIDGVTLGTSASFVQGTTDSVTILSGAVSSDDIGDWKLTGVAISQKVPGGQPADSYTIDMVITITAK